MFWHYPATTLKACTICNGVTKDRVYVGNDTSVALHHTGKCERKYLAKQLINILLAKEVN